MDDGNAKPKRSWETILAAREEVNKPKSLVRRYDRDIYPSSEDQKLMIEVYKGYMRGGDLRELAELYEVPFRTVKYWAYKAGWVRDRTEIDRVEVDESNRKLMLSRAHKVNDIVDKTVEVQRRIIDKVGDMLENEDPGKPLTPNVLRAASEAAKNASDNSLRAVGIGESGANALLATNDGDGEGPGRGRGKKTPLIMVFQGGLPPVRRPEGGAVVEIETEGE